MSVHGVSLKYSAKRLASILLGCTVLTSCALSPIASNPSSFPSLLQESSRTGGLRENDSSEHKRLLAAFGGAYHFPPTQKVVEEIVARLVPATERPEQHYRVTILDTPLVNAFALPTGYIYVTRGLLTLASDSSELAGVMAHEIAHVTAKHATARGELEKQADLISRVNVQVLKDQAGDKAFRENAQGTIAGFSREQELEADRIGIRTSAQAGYDPYGSVRFLNALDRHAHLRMNTSTQSATAVDFMTTHPSTHQRIILALQNARKESVSGSDLRDRNVYLAAINAMNWGEDPRDGEICGRIFRNAHKEIIFTAPDGFTLGISQKSLLGTTANNSQSLRLDIVEVPASEPLDGFLASSWMDGASIESVIGTTINGHPAAIGFARSDNEVFYLGAVRLNNSVFRLVLSSHQASDVTEHEFLASLSSLRKMSASEMRTIKPLRIRIIVAEKHDTPNTMAKRMRGVDRPLERFLIINGLQSGEVLQTGERYKIITE